MSTLHRLLIHHDHGGNVYYIVDTDVQLEAVMRRIYQQAATRGFYDYLDLHYPVYKAAKEGDFKAIKDVLTMRQHAEYEAWEIVCTTDPGTP
jgi:hypothetical protein